MANRKKPAVSQSSCIYPFCGEVTEVPPAASSDRTGAASSKSVHVCRMRSPHPATVEGTITISWAAVGVSVAEKTVAMIICQSVLHVVMGPTWLIEISRARNGRRSRRPGQPRTSARPGGIPTDGGNHTQYFAYRRLLLPSLPARSGRGRRDLSGLSDGVHGWSGAGRTAWWSGSGPRRTSVRRLSRDMAWSFAGHRCRSLLIRLIR